MAHPPANVSARMREPAPAAMREAISPDKLLDRVRERYAGLVQTTTWGERVLFYNPRGAQPKGVYFVSLKERDSASDGASRLDERGAYRLNFGLTPVRYRDLFGQAPGGDASDVDVIRPHPVYAWMSWASVVNPSAETLERLWPLLDETYALACARHATTA